MFSHEDQHVVSGSDIIVTGIRFINTPVYNYFNTVSYWIPREMTLYDLNRERGDSVVYETAIISGTTVGFKVPGLNVNVTMAYADWVKLSGQQQYAISETLKRWDSRETPFKQALERIEDAGASITIRVSSTYMTADGTERSWSDYATIPDANVAWKGAQDGTGNIIRQGDQIYININEAKAQNLSNQTYDHMANTLIHEVLHTFYADNYVDEAGRPTDHPDVYPNAQIAKDQIFQGASPPMNGQVMEGSAKMGSYSPEYLFGTDGADVLAGNGGNDHLSAGLGTNAVFGGPGNDTLVSQGLNDYLAGGVDEDIYVLGSVGAIVSEVGGYDRVVLPGQRNQYLYQQLNYDLIIGVPGTGEIAAYIQNHYLNSDTRVDEFEFYDGVYGSWSIEDLAAGGDGSGGGTGGGGDEPPTDEPRPAAFDDTSKRSPGNFDLAGHSDLPPLANQAHLAKYNSPMEGYNQVIRMDEESSSQDQVSLYSEVFFYGAADYGLLIAPQLMPMIS